MNQPHGASLLYYPYLRGEKNAWTRIWTCNFFLLFQPQCLNCLAMSFYLCCFDLCFFHFFLIYSVFVFKLMRVQFTGVTWDFLSQSQCSVLTFLQFLYSPCLRLYASTCVHTLKITNSVSHAIVRHQTQILVLVQFKTVSMHLIKLICAPPHLSEVSPALPLKQFQYSSDWWWPSLILSRKIN